MTSLDRITRLLALAVALCCGGCAESQMRYNLLSYDNAVAQGANQQLLLNAVRASQNYPMSFTAIGQVLAGPAVGGNIQSEISFSRLAGLTTYSLTPHLDASAGYSNFALDNLNYREFMVAIREPIPPEILDSFYTNTRWPQTLLPMIYLQSLHPTDGQIRTIHAEREKRCGAVGSRHEGRDLCAAIGSLIETYASRCTAHFREIGGRLNDLRRDSRIYYNSARTFCHFARFELLLLEMRLTGWTICRGRRPAVRCIIAEHRPAQQMIAYLGELIAAQNYIEEPFTPFLIVGESTPRGGYEFVEVPLFEVRRGIAPGPAAVSVVHEGEVFHIVRPDFGSRLEARSLQTLDLVLQTLRAATTREKLPKVQTLGIVTSK